MLFLDSPAPASIPPTLHAHILTELNQALASSRSRLWLIDTPGHPEYRPQFQLLAWGTIHSVPHAGPRVVEIQWPSRVWKKMFKPSEIMSKKTAMGVEMDESLRRTGGESGSGGSISWQLLLSFSLLSPCTCSCIIKQENKKVSSELQNTHELP